jgi:hypothetical protein
MWYRDKGVHRVKGKYGRHGGGTWNPVKGELDWLRMYIVFFGDDSNVITQQLKQRKSSETNHISPKTSAIIVRKDLHLSSLQN